MSECGSITAAVRVSFAGSVASTVFVDHPPQQPHPLRARAARIVAYAPRMGDIGFPTTHATWIDRAIAHERLDELRNYFLTSYTEPLVVLLRSHASSLAPDAEEIVHAFLVRTFGDTPQSVGEFAQRARASGMSMRRYVANALLFYTRGVMRDRARNSARMASPSIEHIADVSVTAEIAFERAWAQSIVQDACGRVESTLLASTRGRTNIAWEVFRRHVIDGRRYGDLVEEFGLNPQQMADLVRDVARRLRFEIEQTLALEGVPRPEVASEVERLMDLLCA